MLIRTETPLDAAGIRALTDRAFRGRPYASGTEAQIVDRLRAAGALALSLVADAGGVLAHAAFSPVEVGAGSPGWFALGPVSVTPERQRQGIGSAVIREGLARMRASGAAGVLLLGDPGYYLRFGFTGDSGLLYRGAPTVHLMALPMHGPVPAGEVRFHPAFDG
jgi:putative acetyltransferase